jgi:hypothetical protein
MKDLRHSLLLLITGSTQKNWHPTHLRDREGRTEPVKFASNSASYWHW